MSLRRIRSAYWRLVVPATVQRQGVTVHGTVRYYGAPIISRAPGSTISIGARCVLCSVSESTALGVNHPVILRTLRADARLSIGDDTGLSGATICAARSVSIGSRVLLGANVTVVDTDFHPVAARDRRFNSNHDDIAASPVTICDDVFIGAGALILKGVTVGENSIVGAGSVVTKSLPANVIAAGNPARIIRELHASER